jgi:murein DD-endopeptidase MepM/ murein hydrolase activator NlpD
MSARRISVAALAGCLLLAMSVVARAQEPGEAVGEPQATTTTTSPAPAVSLPGGAPDDDPSPPPSEPPPTSEAPSGGGEGDGGAPPPGTPTSIPPEYQRLIASIRRTRANNTRALLDALRPLTRFGLTEQEAFVLGLGRFPVAGPATWSDDWWNPRFVPYFHLHIGTDIFAPAGTPVRAPVDGSVRVTNGPVGGLAVYVTMRDRTYFYMAHLSALAAGLADGQTVKTGQVIGYVGDSGNARGGAPHLHIELHPRGGPPIPPKPYLDRFVAEALAQAPVLVQRFQQAWDARAAAAMPPPPHPPEPPPGAGDPPGPPAVRWASSMSPSGGPLQLAEAEVVAATGAIDWARHAARVHARLERWLRADRAARAWVRPSISPTLARALGL